MALTEKFLKSSGIRLIIIWLKRRNMIFYYFQKTVRKGPFRCRQKNHVYHCYISYVVYIWLHPMAAFSLCDFYVLLIKPQKFLKTAGNWYLKASFPWMSTESKQFLHLNITSISLSALSSTCIVPLWSRVTCSSTSAFYQRYFSPSLWAHKCQSNSFQHLWINLIIFNYFACLLKFSSELCVKTFNDFCR